MLITVALLLGSAVMIYLACETFVNGVEWVGQRFGVSQTATGTILAAFGTALPESVVTLVATAFGGDPAQKEIGVGAALGGPLALSTVAYGVVGLTLLVAGRRRSLRPIVQVDGRRLSRDQGWFLFVFGAKIALGLFAAPWKVWTGFLFLAAYAVYFWTEMARGGAEKEAPKLEPLRFAPKRETPPAWLAVVQTLFALAVISVASRVFVAQLEHVGPWLGLSPQVAALLLSPLATELPETMNAVIWVRQGKERLALANISGAMMIQATIPTAFGLFFTPWILDRGLLIAAGVTAIAVAALYTLFRRGAVSAVNLANVGWLYAAFGLLLAAT